jgi:hypothetical protein
MSNPAQKPPTRYHIVLRHAGLSPAETSYLRRFMSGLTHQHDEDGTRLIVLNCKNIDASDPTFIVADVIPLSLEPLRLWIPKQFVLLIGDFSAEIGDAAKPMGFTAT